MSYLLIALGAYLLGSVPSGYLIGRARGVDIRKAGSGNIGATNALRVLGKKWGYLCFVADIGKGLIAVLVARTIAASHYGLDPEWCGIVAAAAVILGHNFPVWLGFKGGKGIATSAGVILGLFPYPVFLGGLVVWVVVFFATRYVSLASILGAIALPVAVVIVAAAGWPGIGPASIVLAVLIALMAVWRHRSNIQRLRAGTEARFERKRTNVQQS